MPNEDLIEVFHSVTDSGVKLSIVFNIFFLFLILKNIDRKENVAFTRVYVMKCEGRDWRIKENTEEEEHRKYLVR